jgi:hypothetical protein
VQEEGARKRHLHHIVHAQAAASVVAVKRQVLKHQIAAALNVQQAARGRETLARHQRAARQAQPARPAQQQRRRHAKGAARQVNEHAAAARCGRQAVAGSQRLARSQRGSQRSSAVSGARGVCAQRNGRDGQRGRCGRGKYWGDQVCRVAALQRQRREARRLAQQQRLRSTAGQQEQQGTHTGHFCCCSGIATKKTFLF